MLGGLDIRRTAMRTSPSRQTAGPYDGAPPPEVPLHVQQQQHAAAGAPVAKIHPSRVRLKPGATLCRAPHPQQIPFGVED